MWKYALHIQAQCAEYLYVYVLKGSLPGARQFKWPSLSNCHRWYCGLLCMFSKYLHYVLRRWLFSTAAHWYSAFAMSPCTLHWDPFMQKIRSDVSRNELDWMKEGKMHRGEMRNSGRTYSIVHKAMPMTMNISRHEFSFWMHATTIHLLLGQPHTPAYEECNAYSYIFSWHSICIHEEFDSMHAIFGPLNNALLLCNNCAGQLTPEQAMLIQFCSVLCSF